MARKNGNTEVVEPLVTDEVVETNEASEMKTETDVVETETTEVSEVPEVTEVPEVSETVDQTEVTSIQWSSIKPTLDDLEVNGLREVIDYCENRITELQRNEVEELEEEMRAIQDKLLAMKGFRGKQVVKTEKTEEAKRTRTEKVVINPDNPSQVYRFGKIPEWLDQLCVKTGKQVWELRVDRPASA